jgi:hypothetical protein
MSTERENIKKELKEISPELGNLETTNPFMVPNGYFEYLPHEIQKRKRVSESPAELWLGFFPREMIRIAAVTLILVVAVATGLLLVNRPDQQMMVNHEDDELYFEEYLAWYSDYQQLDFYELISENNFQADDGLASEELLIDYLIDYSYYYQQSIDELIED